MGGNRRQVSSCAAVPFCVGWVVTNHHHQNLITETPDNNCTVSSLNSSSPADLDRLLRLPLPTYYSVASKLNGSSLCPFNSICHDVRKAGYTALLHQLGVSCNISSVLEMDGPLESILRVLQRSQLRGWFRTEPPGPCVSARHAEYPWSPCHCRKAALQVSMNDGLSFISSSVIITTTHCVSPCLSLDREHHCHPHLPGEFFPVLHSVN